MAPSDSKNAGCGSIRPQLIRDELVLDKAIFLQQLPHDFQRRPLVPLALDQHLEHFALGVDGAPKIDHAAIDFQIDFVQMPSRMGLELDLPRKSGEAFAQPDASFSNRVGLR